MENSSVENISSRLKSLKTASLFVAIVSFIVAIAGIFLSQYLVIFALSFFIIASVFTMTFYMLGLQKSVNEKLDHLCTVYLHKNWPIPYVTLMEDYDPSVSDKNNVLILDEDNAFAEIEKYKKYLNNVFLELYAIETFSREVMDLEIGVESIRQVVEDIVSYFEHFQIFNGAIIFDQKPISFNAYSEEWVANINRLEQLMKEVNENIKMAIREKMYKMKH